MEFLLAGKLITIANSPDKTFDDPYIMWKSKAEGGASNIFVRHPYNSYRYSSCSITLPWKIRTLLEAVDSVIQIFKWGALYTHKFAQVHQRDLKELLEREYSITLPDAPSGTVIRNGVADEVFDSSAVSAAINIMRMSSNITRLFGMPANSTNSYRDDGTSAAAKENLGAAYRELLALHKALVDSNIGSRVQSNETMRWMY